MELPEVRPEIRAFTVYGTRPAPGAARMAGNEWPEPTPAGRYLTQDELDGLMLNRYPASPPDLRGLLASQYGVKPEQLIVGNGSIDTLLLALLVFGGHGRKTLLFQPTYAMHSRLTTIAGGTPVDEMIGLPYRVTRERAHAAMERVHPEVVFFCTPNNPTGSTIDDDVITSVAARYPKTLVLLDEAYSDIAGHSLVPALRNHPNLVISKTFSKVHAAAALRIGILIVHPEMISLINAIQYPFNVSVVATALATRIAKDDDTIRRRIEMIRSERERLYRALVAVDGIEAFPSEANFVLFRIKGDTAAAQARFVEQGVLIRDMTSWTGAEGCLRVSVGTPAENDLFISALGRVFAPVRA